MFSLIWSRFKLESLLVIGFVCIFGGTSICSVSGAVSGNPDISGPSTVFEGETLTLICSATCTNNTECTYLWTSDIPDSGSLTNDRLIVNNIKRNPVSNVKYSVKCTVTDEGDNDEKSSSAKTVGVYYGPDSDTVAIMPSGKRVVVHEKNTHSFTITCSATCHPSPCNIVWSRDTATVSSIPVLYTYSDITRTEAGNYTCKAVNTVNTTSFTERYVEIDVYYGPDKATVSPTPVKNKITVPELDTSNSDVIKCAGTCHPSPCKIKWMRGQQEQEAADSAELTLYEVKVIDRQDAGNYDCVVKNRETTLESKSSVEIVVQYPPDITLTWNQSSSTLRCEASGVPDSYTFHKWSHTRINTPIRNLTGTTQGAVSMVKFPSPNYQDTGKYTCSVDNGISDPGTGQTIMKKEIYAEVADRPLLVASKDSYNVSKGDQLSFEIDVYALPQPLTEDVAMYKVESDGNRTLVMDVNITNQDHYVDVGFYSTEVQVTGTKIYVVIEAMKEEHFGNHTVVINNKEGRNTSTDVTLYPQGAPDPPSNLTEAGFDHESVTLTFTSGFFNGADQTFIVEYAPSSESDWTNGTFVTAGDKNRVLFSARVEGLSPETEYMFRSYSFNAFDQSDYADVIVNVTTLAAPLPLAAIIGGAIGGFVLIFCVVVVVILYRKSSHKKEIPEVPQTIPYSNLLAASNDTYNGGYNNETTSGLRQPKVSPHTSTNSGGTDSGIDVATYENTTFRQTVPTSTQQKDPTRQSEAIYQNCAVDAKATKPNQPTVDEEDYVNSSQYKVPPPKPGQTNQYNTEFYQVPTNNAAVANGEPQEDAYLDMNVVKNFTSKPKAPMSPRRDLGKIKPSADPNPNTAEEAYMPMDVVKHIATSNTQKPATKHKPVLRKQNNKDENEGEEQYLKMDTFSGQLQNKLQQRTYANKPFQGVDPYKNESVAVNSNPSGQDYMYDVPKNRESVPDYIAPPPPMPATQKNAAGEEDYMNLVTSPKPR